MNSFGNSDIRLLHVDDDAAFAELVGLSLERRCERFRVVSVGSAREALDRLDEEPAVDCVLSDYDMPEMDGLALLERVRETHPRLPFVLYTAKGGEEIAAEAIGNGVDDYIQKGSSAAHFLTLGTRIEREVARARAEREKQVRLEALEAAREGICIVDADGRFRYANETYLDLYGYERSELVGEPWQRLHTDAAVETIETDVLPHVAEHGQWGGTCVGLRADGTTFRESKSVSTLSGGELVIVVTEHEATDD
ncbi:response regulator [Salinigranum sp.]|uniref:response regulator n=1 Tax=Salinigranum sp. TaxID=1966351 RepID=UPI003569F887